MQRSATQGVVWTFLSYASTKVITVATTIVLAHLLVPRDFGLVALAWTAISLLSVFNDVGLGGVFVYRQDLDERMKGTVLTVMVLMSLLLAGLLIGTAPALGHLMRSSRLPGVLDAFALTLLLSGPVWFYQTLLQREMEFGRGLISRLAQVVVWTAVAITSAALGAGVWSLVAGQIASTIVYLVVLAALSPYRVRPVFDWGAAVSLARQGAGYVAQATQEFFQQNSDYLTIGRVLGAGPLGIYSMAFRLGDLTYWGIADPVAKVTFPVFARMKGRGEDVTAAYLHVLRLVALAGCPVGVLLSATADPFTRFVFGHSWLAMITPLTALGLWAALRAVEATAGWLLISIGRPGINARVGFLLLIGLVPALIFAAHADGIVAVSWVMTAHMLVSMFALMYCVGRRLGSSVSAQLRALLPILVASGAAWVSARLAAEAMTNVPAVAGFTTALLAGLAVYGAVLALIAPEVLRSAVARIGQALGRPPRAAVPAA